MKKELEQLSVRSFFKHEYFLFQEDNAQLDDRRNQAEAQLNSHLLECGPKIKNFKEGIYNIIREYNVAEVVCSCNLRKWDPHFRLLRTIPSLITIFST